jgi:serine/threonine protein kinase
MTRLFRENEAQNTNVQLLRVKTQPKTDIWTLGVIAYNMLTENLPVSGEVICLTTTSLKQILPCSPRSDKFLVKSKLDEVVALGMCWFANVA